MWYPEWTASCGLILAATPAATMLSVSVLLPRLPVSIATLVLSHLLIIQLASYFIWFMVCPASTPLMMTNAGALPNLWERHSVHVSDGVTLDAGYWENPERQGNDCVIVYFNANAMRMEDVSGNFLNAYARSLKCSALAFNYRGVGGSTGTPSGTVDLIQDGAAVVLYAQEELGYHPKDLILHGWSLGGGVAPMVAPNESIVISDRSFSSLEAVAVSMMSSDQFVLAAMLAAILVFAYGMSFVVSLRFLGLKVTVATVYWLSVCAGVSAMFGSSMFGSHVAVPLMKQTGWGMNVTKAWLNHPAGLRLALYHPMDGIIPLDASLSLSDGLGKSDTVVKLKGPPCQGASCHLYSLPSAPREWRNFLKRVKKMLRQGPTKRA